jgi:hypothetical protein
MTGKADFSEEEWTSILQGPPTAGMIVVTAQKGGVFRETLALAKGYSAARDEHGQSELLDEIVSAKPSFDRGHSHSPEELRATGLEHLREAVGLLEQKASPDEVAAYKRFVLDVARRVANAHREDGVNVSPAEQAALDELEAALG